MSCSRHSQQTASAIATGILLMVIIVNYILNKLTKGEQYSDTQVVFIVLANFILFNDTKTWYEMHRILNVENGEWRMRGMEFHFIEIPQLRKIFKQDKNWPDTGLERLLYYLGTMGGECNMQNLAAMDSRIDKLLELEREFRNFDAEGRSSVRKYD